VVNDPFLGESMTRGNAGPARQGYSSGSGTAGGAPSKPTRTTTAYPASIFFPDEFVGQTEPGGLGPRVPLVQKILIRLTKTGKCR
jgi:hypothetical protein